jgi:hypothetical protein
MQGQATDVFELDEELLGLIAGGEGSHMDPNGRGSAIDPNGAD